MNSRSRPSSGPGRRTWRQTARRRRRLAAATRSGKLVTMSKSPEELSKIRAKAGALGGKKLTPKKQAQLASIAAKGGKAVTPKKRQHLAGIAAKGGSTVTEKKREHLRKALAARWAKAKLNSAT